MCLERDELDEIKFYKRKIVIDDYFKSERCPNKRKKLFQKLLLSVHPDKQDDYKEQDAIQSYVLEYLMTNKEVFKGEHNLKMATVMPLKFVWNWKLIELTRNLTFQVIFD